MRNAICRNMIVLLFVALQLHNAAHGGEFKVGLARTTITPTSPLWLSGYGHRTAPAEGKVHDLWAKAVAFESSDSTRLVLVTLDLGSVNPQMTEAIAAEATRRFQLPRSNLILNCSHTHCAPEIAEERLVFHDLPDEEEAKIAQYIEELNGRLVDLVGEALANLQPAKISVSRSSAGFAFNRRHPSGVDPQGVVDRDVPVMKIADEAGALRAVLFGYACHNTTLNFQLYCGDYAGFAQEEIEAKHPGVQAMFVMGCGGDQNPQPRHGRMGLEHAKRHGRELADAVEAALDGAQQPVRGPLRVAFDVVELELELPASVNQLSADASKGRGDVGGRKAQYLLGLIERGEAIPTIERCPLHVARFGDDLLMIFLSGETVVDYSLRCKTEFAGPFVWAAGYCDDVFAYLPSRRVLLEGGYEGGGGIVHQLTPAPFTPNVEKQVMDCLRKLVQDVQ